LKSKFISIIVGLAVVLALTVTPVVPAVPMALTPTALAAGVVGIEVVPQLTQKGFGQDFSVEIWVNDTTATVFNAAGVRLVYDTKYVNATKMTNGTWDYVADSDYNNTWSPTQGLVRFDATMLGPTFNTSKKVCSVNFTTTSNVANSGISGLDFIYIVDDSATSVPNSGVDVLDWGKVVNGTLKVGTPTLTVNVIPGGEGTVNQVPSGPYSWDQVVTLTAVNSTAGWGWASWSGTNDDAVNPTTVTMNTDKTVNATFAELPPVLAVSPLSLAFSARFGNNIDNDTVTISNDGGGTLCWAVGQPPAWTNGDNWTYWNSYNAVLVNGSWVPYPNPYYNPFICPVNDTVLTMTVTGQDANYYYGFADWPATDPQRTANTSLGKIPACMQDASVVVNKATLDYVQQVANLTLYLPNATPGEALVTWAYTGCHGWPYYAGKTWFYTMTVTDATGTTVHNAQAMVTGYNSTMGAWIITHGSPNLAGQIFMQQYWSDTVRNFVYQWDGGTFNAPPLDVRQLTGFNVSAPAPALPPNWISFDKTHGSLGIGGSEVLTVTANTSGLAVGDYSGSFDITAPGSIQTKTVDVSLEVLPATTIDVIRELPADALDENAEYPGMNFTVWVNFTASVNNFTSIGLTDLAPAGWAVQTDVSWCTPNATWTKGKDNKAEYAWSGPAGGYTAGTEFHAMYKVTIPATATPGYNNWPQNDGTKAWAEYWFGAKGPYTSNVTGNWTKIVTVPGKVVGETRDVNADLLTTTLVTLNENPAVYKDEDSSTDPNATYSVLAHNTGQYWMNATKYCYKFVATNAGPAAFTIDFGDTAKLAAGKVFDFEGNFGLVPKACNMSYAMKSVNHWLFIPIDKDGNSHPEWQLSVWKADDSVASWQFPSGCNT